MVQKPTRQSTTTKQGRTKTKTQAEDARRQQGHQPSRTFSLQIRQLQRQYLEPSPRFSSTNADISITRRYQQQYGYVQRKSFIYATTTSPSVLLLKSKRGILYAFRACAHASHGTQIKCVGIEILKRGRKPFQKCKKTMLIYVGFFTKPISLVNSLFCKYSSLTVIPI